MLRHQCKPSQTVSWSGDGFFQKAEVNTVFQDWAQMQSRQQAHIVAGRVAHLAVQLFLTALLVPQLFDSLVCPGAPGNHIVNLFQLLFGEHWDEVPAAILGIHLQK